MKDGFLYNSTDQAKPVLVHCYHAGSSENVIDISPSGVIIGRHCFEAVGSSAPVTISFPPQCQVRKLASFAFSHGHLENVEIPRSVEVIGSFCFQYCDPLIIKFVRDSQLREIKRCAFLRSGIEAVEVPSEVQVIEDSAFQFCQRLNRIAFSERGVSLRIEGHVFQGTSIERIQLPGRIQHLCASSLIGIEPVCVGASSLPLKLSSGVLIDESKHRIIRAVGDSRVVVIHQEIVFFGEWSFADLATLQSVSFSPNSSLQLIEEFAFSKSSIERILLPRTVRSIRASAFLSCRSLSEIAFDESSLLSTIEFQAFWDCELLRSVLVPVSLTRLDRSAFGRLTELFVMVSDEREVLEWQLRSGIGTGCGEHRFGRSRRSGLSEWRSDISRFVPGPSVGRLSVRVCRDFRILVAEFEGIDNAEFEGRFGRLPDLYDQCIAPFFGCGFPSESARPWVGILASDGQSLRSLLSATGLQIPMWWTAAEKAITVAGIVRAMKIAHASGVVHGDLRPACVYVLSFGLRVEVSEIGLFRWMRFDEKDEEERRFSSPSVCRGEVCSEKDDVFSFGLILWEIVSCRPIPAEVADGEAFRTAILNFEELGFEENFSVRSSIRSLIRRCLSLDPKERPTFVDIGTEMERYQYRVIKGVSRWQVQGFLNMFDEAA
jgi:serine/threonine-protein kinase